MKKEDNNELPENPTFDSIWKPATKSMLSNTSETGNSQESIILKVEILEAIGRVVGPLIEKIRPGS